MYTYTYTYMYIISIHVHSYFAIHCLDILVTVNHNTLNIVATKVGFGRWYEHWNWFIVWFCLSWYVLSS